MVKVSVLQLMDEIELRHGVHEDRWNILRGILEKQAEREAAQQAAQQADGACTCKGSPPPTDMMIINPLCPKHGITRR